MKLLIACPVPDDTLEFLPSDNVVYRPDLAKKGGRFLATTLTRLCPEMLAVESVPDCSALAAWAEVMGEQRRFVIVRGGFGDPLTPVTCDGHVSFHHAPACPGEPEADLLGFAERLYNEHVTCCGTDALLADQRRNGLHHGDSVVVVGAGIVGLISALGLVRAGLRVTLIDGCPDPRGLGHWTTFGCTRGGDNARMFTLTEADCYNHQSLAADMNSCFRRPVSGLGWRLCDDQALGPAERRWIDEFEAIPPSLARSYNDDIFGFNAESRGLWEELMQAMPSLFEGVELHSGILRLYTDPQHLDQSLARQRRVGAFRALLTAAEVGARYPSLKEPCASGLIAGGIEVVGFTVNVHNLIANLVAALEVAGVTCWWNTTATEIARDGAGAVCGLRSTASFFEADHYVVSPGAYGRDLLRARCLRAASRECSAPG